MTYVYKLLKLRINEYHTDSKKFKNYYNYPTNIYGEFDAIQNNKIDKIIDTIQIKKSSDHKILYKYPNIIKFIDTYKNDFSDCIDVILNEFKNYKKDIYDETFLLGIGFDCDMLKLKLATVKRQYKNITSLFNNNLSVNKIKKLINTDYPLNTRTKINSINKLCMLFLKLASEQEQKHQLVEFKQVLFNNPRQN